MPPTDVMEYNQYQSYATPTASCYQYSYQYGGPTANHLKVGLYFYCLLMRNVVVLSVFYQNVGITHAFYDFIPVPFLFGAGRRSPMSQSRALSSTHHGHEW